jgi:outer membrane protein assembly factor BamB
MAHWWPFQVAGIELTSVLLIAGILVEGDRLGYPVTGLIVRKKRKKYGRQRLIEGDPNRQLPIVLVDDSINSSQSMNKALLALQTEHLSAIAAFSIVSFESATATEWGAHNNLPISHLFTPHDFGLHVSEETPPITAYSVIWSFVSDKPNYGFAVAKSQPVVHEESILFGADNGIFWCLNKMTGDVRWSFDTETPVGKGIISSPLVVDGNIYFGTYGGRVYCIEMRTGKPIWEARLCDWVGSSPCFANGHIYIALEYDAPGAAGGLVKICAESGRRVWEVPTREMLHGSPVYSEKYDLVVIGTNDGTVLCIRASDGDVRHLLKVGGPIKSRCALSGELAVFGAFDGKIYVWDFVNDVIKLTVETEDIVYSQPLICGNRAFVGCADQTLRIIDLDPPAQRHRIEVGDKIHSAPVLIGNRLFVGTSGGELLGFDAHTFAITHRLQFPERLTNAVVYDSGILYVYAYDNKLWAIRFDELNARLS